MSNTPSVEILQPNDNYQEALDVRYRVFVEGQGVPVEIEQDGEDKHCTHFVVHSHDKPVGAGRLRELDDETVKIERMAVLEEHRNQGLGRQMLNAMLDLAKERGYPEAMLNAQMTAVAFYRQAGFEETGERFYEAGIPHIRMERAL